MLALAAVNALSVVAFAAVYGAAAMRLVSQGAFLVALVAVFGAAAAVWVRTERTAARRGDAIARLGRIAAALVGTLIAVPVAALMPLFALQSHVPPEAGLDHVIARTMVLLLAAAGLAALVNIAGGCVIAVSAVMGRWRAPARPRA